MSKAFRFFFFTAWAMIAVGVFSIVTGLMTTMDFNISTVDRIGNQTLFNFINGGSYFMLCGAIHVVAGFLGLLRLNYKIRPLVCIIAGIFTLAWQLAAFIYLLTLNYISIRAALMVVLPIVYLISIIVSEFKVRLVPSQNTQGEGEQTSTKKTFVVKNVFSNFNFTFKRKSLDIPVFEGKRKTKSFSGFQLGGKRRKTRRISMRKFKKR